MSQFFQIHPDNPQKRLVHQAVDILRKGGVVVYPTDSAYAIGCHLDDKQAADRIKRIRKLDDKHNFTLMCRDLSDVGVYAKVDNTQYRLLKTFTPGPYTFILDATSEVPRRLLNPKRRTIGLRVPDNAIVQALLGELGEPIMSSTLILPGEENPMTDPYEIREMLEHELDLIIDGGFCGMEATTVVNMTGDVPEVTREGKGDPEPFRV
ncbi:tRNA threonylcarbamoyl adenosine modification protein, Sua5/YciO/YrdC/YwlC family [Marinobacter daqiaonensis]|uniref:tRNA threonylcarbamoyl adenosine modification protein, Sua5/YciO/YrdC/YwlC family n=1 Tax=Marinobacter daqiaonensis TaxID=650891 RepID=A0A1I6JFL5_9GAMM|nr:L-threonylcarbamoyladenylate synthase [Marinobacter daqiaonensis]SFR77767.1 tRNA threonylcarbamoyl adenosine modification protein, Sua5/YciO/YrdC/YwlC family [Marinobacter daqiaonensis]